MTQTRVDPAIASSTPLFLANPGAETSATCRRNALRGPNYWRTDASLFKKFNFNETMELEFRIESVNFFNHVNLGSTRIIYRESGEP